MEYMTLNNGVEMPILGFGVYQMNNEETKEAVQTALQVGYRSIDTAQHYQNEEAVGQAVKESGISRDDVFLTSKVWHSFSGYEAAKKSVYRSLERLGTDYIDLMLIHQPFGDYYGIWRALEDLNKEGLIRAIGVSNFYPDRFEDLVAFNEIVPAINQLETHMYLQNSEEQAYLEEKGSKLQAWSPFARGENDFFTDPRLQEIGDQYGKTNAQVILRYFIQRGVNVIPKSVHPDRIKQNFDVFDFQLSDQDMETIKGFNQNQHVFRNHHELESVKAIVSQEIPE